MGPDALQNLEAIAAGHHDIEEDGSPVPVDGAFGTALAIMLHRDLKTHRLEVISHELAELSVIVNDEKAHGMPKMATFSALANFLTQS
jgi:hypothetical protein